MTTSSWTTGTTERTRLSFLVIRDGSIAEIVDCDDAPILAWQHAYSACRWLRSRGFDAEVRAERSVGGPDRFRHSSRRVA